MMKILLQTFLNKTDETERKSIYSHFVGEYDITEEDYIYLKKTSYQPKCIAKLYHTWRIMYGKD